MNYEVLPEHQVVLVSRSALTISGVEEVERFDESAITLHTSQGLLVVRGQALQIEKLSLDGGDLKVEGQVDSLTYEDDPSQGGGFFARLFG